MDIFFELHDIRTDANSDIYITGSSYNLDIMTNPVSFNGLAFAGYTFTQLEEGENYGTGSAYVIKLDPQGQLIWGTNPDHESYPGYKIAMNGNELAIATMAYKTTWGPTTVNSDLTSNSLWDPAVYRFDATTGVVLGVNVINGEPGSSFAIELTSAIDTDIYGNYVLGGFMMTGGIFANHPTIPLLSPNGGNGDFWMARLARTDCSGQLLSSQQVAGASPIKPWPNPTTGNLHLDNLNGTTGYRIMDLQGRQVVQGELEQDGSIDMQDMANGIYLLILDTPTGRQTEKIVVER
jgi:hypothetical protein